MFPREFEEALSPLGRRVLRGKALNGVLGDPALRFCAADGVLREPFVKEALRALEGLHPLLTPLQAPIPPETIYAQTKNYEELLPKTMRQRTAYLERKKGRAAQWVEETGLGAMMRSESFAAFARQLAGTELRKKHGIQVLCYGPGDYAGPHTDHHPEEPAAADGYVDVHFTLCNKRVKQQWLVYARRGHFSEVVDAAMRGGVTGYRLPFWHYTTPLVGDTGARRWVLLGTFLFQGSRAAKPKIV